MLSTVVIALGLTWPAAPFAAQVRADALNVRAAASGQSPSVGVLHRGDRVVVVDCTPSCDERGWADVGGGMVRLSELAPIAGGNGPLPRYRYGRVSGNLAVVRASPQPGARIVERRTRDEYLAFVVGDAQAGWLERPHGGWVRERDIELLTPSSFAGEFAPKLPLAFALRDQPGLLRFGRTPVLDEQRGRVQTDAGELRRSAVRIARPRPRPAGVAAGDFWLHVDTAEQTLVAYEGDTPVFATLVSTGKKETPTPRGRFRVWYKDAHGAMHGELPKHYFVDEVPFIQYFIRDRALHGTFWHERFGRKSSHGCVNLSMADAEWLFRWAPPRLPDGWHAIEPGPANLASVWVEIE